MDREIRVGLSSWIIQDGNYPDLKIEEIHAFALEFWTDAPFEILASGQPALSWRNGSNYSITGAVKFIGDRWWVLDAGLPMYSDQLAPPAPVGSVVTTNIYVGVDHFSYFETLARQPGAPPLIYDWRIEAIELDTTPLIETKRRLFERDPSRPASKAVTRTDAWRDDEGVSQYTLTCRRTGSEPRWAR